MLHHCVGPTLHVVEHVVEHGHGAMAGLWGFAGGTGVGGIEPNAVSLTIVDGGTIG